MLQVVDHFLSFYPFLTADGIIKFIILMPDNNPERSKWQSSVAIGDSPVVKSKRRRTAEWLQELKSTGNANTH